MLVGLYRPGTSMLHRTRPTIKLVGLLVFTSLLVGLRSPGVVLVGALVVTAGYAAAGYGPRTLLAQIWPLRWVLLLLVPFQWWAGGPVAVVTFVGALVVAVVAAALLTLTTTVSDLLDVVTVALRPLSRIGVDADRIALLLALTLRSIPVLMDVARTASDARRARGLERSPRALLVPIVVRAVRHAQATGDALVARGVDD